MEVPEVEERKKGASGAQMTSAAAFVEGGIQDVCEDACSICLEDFTSSDPSTLTKCRHEYHLQCILEWCQRSSDCPMCLQPVSLKDPSSQELFAAVERERKIRAAASRNTTIFRHPTLGDFELQHVLAMQLPVGASEAELEERIIQHLAAAAAMGRSHYGGRRETQRSRSAAAQRRPHYLVFSSPHNGNARTGQVSSSMPQVARESEPPAINIATPSTPLTGGRDEPTQLHASSESSNRHTTRGENTRQSSLPSQDAAGSSDLQSFSESLKSKLSAVSMRYRESFSRSTRGWKERFFSRSNSLSDIGSEVRREVNAGIASVSRIMERLESRDSTGTSGGSQSISPAHTDNRRERESNRLNVSNSSSPFVASAAASGST
ncbi:unnamed protein product [Linum tenue]|uniref:RING-type E3 ubiquitin transferase n=1 Tax=Linum tenue TaxID=586396 RepID=A0AAV0IY61_9ROSI|nr:unnamed protein product [Linum tenue]